MRAFSTALLVAVVMMATVAAATTGAVSMVMASVTAQQAPDPKPAPSVGQTMIAAGLRVASTEPVSYVTHTPQFSPATQTFVRYINGLPTSDARKRQNE